MSDLLNMDLINSLPQPLWGKQFGNWWPIHDICVQTGMARIDVCGMLEVTHFAAFMEIKDDSGKIHDTEDWYL